MWGLVRQNLEGGHMFQVNHVEGGQRATSLSRSGVVPTDTVTEKINSLLNVIGNDPEKKALALVQLSRNVLPLVAETATALDAITKLFIFGYPLASETERAAALQTINAHFQNEFLGLYQTFFPVIDQDQIEHKPPRVDIGPLLAILAKFKQTYASLIEQTLELTGIIQLEHNRFDKARDFVQNYGDLSKSVVKKHYEAYEKTRDKVAQHLNSISEITIKCEETKKMINACVDEFLSNNNKDCEKIRFLHLQFQKDIVGAVEMAKYKKESWFNHSFVITPLANIENPIFNPEITEANFHHFLENNLSYYKEMQTSLKELKEFGKKILWIKDTMSSNPKYENANEETLKRKSQKISEKYSVHQQKIIDSLNEYAKFNQILNLIREILLNDLNEKMNGLGEQKNTIMQQSNSLLEECKKLDELVNTTSTQDFSPILEKKK